MDIFKKYGLSNTLKFKINGGLIDECNPRLESIDKNDNTNESANLRGPGGSGMISTNI